MAIRFNKVVLANDFTHGALNEECFVDLPFMEEHHRQALATFIGRVTREEPLPGKNKPSWLNDDQEKLPDTDAYQDGNYWHYHCGPYNDTTRLKSMTYNLSLNLSGLTSAEVIHYQKMDDGTVFVVGFSPKHQPFPASDNNNPLFLEDE